MKAFSLVFFLLVTLRGAAAATEVEMEACEYTAAVKKELQLSPAQEPKFEKVFSDDLAPLRVELTY